MFIVYSFIRNIRRLPPSHVRDAPVIGVTAIAVTMETIQHGDITLRFSVNQSGLRIQRRCCVTRMNSRSRRDAF